jgi:general stress protein YciG
MTFKDDPELARSAGAKGGNKTATKYGRDYYRQIGEKGGQKIANERGADFFSEIGKKGGAARAAKAKARRESSENTSD